MFVRGAPPYWYLVDQTGLPLNDTDYVFFLTNVFPYTPQTVYQDPDGNVAWSNPIEVQPNGTLPDNIYGDPNLVYRIEIRAGNSQYDALIGNPIQNYVFGGEGTAPSGTIDFQYADNLITNPQFAFINFSNDDVNPYTISVAGTYNIAPGWDLVLTGSGSTTLQQIALTGEDFAAYPGLGNPPFALNINNSGWTTAELIQTTYNNGAIFENGSIAFSILARGDGGPQILALTYDPSGTTNPTTVVPPTSVSSGVFSILGDAVNVQASQNTNTGESAYVQWIITLPASGQVDITNVQALGQSTQLVAATTAPLFQEQTVEQELNNTFNVYADSILIHPKASLLTGWNFSLNPFQFSNTSLTAMTNPIVNQCQYVTDQTILYQSSASSFNVGQESSTGRKMFQVQAAASATTPRFALIQYVDPATILPYWNYLVSALLRIGLWSPTNNYVRIKMRLIYNTNAGLPPTIGNTEPILSWSGNDPVFSSNWAAIVPPNDPAYVLQNYNSNQAGPYEPLPFNGIQLPSAATGTQALGIVIYTVDDLVSTSGMQDSIVFDKVSLSQNAFAIDTPPQTFDEVLRECQYYYESSYDPGYFPIVSTPYSEITRLQLAIPNPTNYSMFTAPFDVQFNTIKRGTPVITLYSPAAGTSGSVDCIINNSGSIVSSGTVVASSFWTQRFVGRKGFQYISATNTAPLNSSASSACSACVLFHYRATAVLGL